MTVLIASATAASPTDCNNDSTQSFAEVFEAVNSATLDSLIIDMKTNGTPTGSFNFQIYAITGTYGSTAIPTGSPLATSDTITVASLTSSYATYTVTFSGANRISIISGGQYAVACNYTNTPYPNAIFLKIKTPSFYGGNSAYKATGTWNAFATHDLLFDLQGVSASGNTSSFFAFM